MTELDAKYFYGLNAHFDTAKPFISGVAGLGIGTRLNILNQGSNFALNFCNDAVSGNELVVSKQFDDLSTSRGSSESEDIFSATTRSNVATGNDIDNRSVSLLELTVNNSSIQNTNYGFLKFNPIDKSNDVSVNKSCQFIVSEGVPNSDSHIGQHDNFNNHSKFELTGNSNSISDFAKYSMGFKRYTDKGDNEYYPDVTNDEQSSGIDNFRSATQDMFGSSDDRRHYCTKFIIVQSRSSNFGFDHGNNINGL